MLDRPRLRLVNAEHFVDQVEWVEGDFTNLADIDQALAGCEVVFHLVSTTLPKTSNDNPVYDVESNVVGTLRMLDVARRHNLKKIIFLSSGGTVYGVPEQVPIPETHPTDPICSYGIGKLAIEKYLELNRRLHDFDYGVLRLANPFGEYQRVSAAQGAIAVFLHKALRDEVIEIWGDGSVVRDYVYISDVTDAMLKLMNYEGACHIFNIGSGQGHSLNDLLKIVETILARPVRCKYMPGRMLDVPTNVLDISRAASLLGWQPRVSLVEGMERVFDYMRMRNSSYLGW